MRIVLEVTEEQKAALVRACLEQAERDGYDARVAVEWEREEPGRVTYEAATEAARAARLAVALMEVAAGA